MNRFVIVLALLIGGTAVAQMDGMAGMPGMAPAKKPAPAPLPDAPRNTTTTQGNKAADAAAESVRASQAQQRGQAAYQAGAQSDAQSLHRDTAQVQEAENLTLRTGTNLPAPELLNDAARRTPIALQQFIDWAEHGNPTLAQARALVERSTQQARQAALYPNPTVGYSGEHIRGGSYHGGEEGAFVQQTIVTGGKLGLRRDVYRAQAAAGEAGVQVQAARVRGDVQSMFYQALAAQAQVVVRQRLLQLTLDAVDTVHQLANVGQADAPDVLQTEVEAEQAKIDFVDAQRLYLQRFQVLAAMCAQTALAVSPLAGDLEQVPNMDADASVARAIADSPIVRQAQQQVAATQAELKATKREVVPDVSVQAGEWYSGERLEGIHKAAGWMGFAQAGVVLPLWNRNQGNAEAAKADVARAAANVTRTQLQMKQQTEPMAQEYLAARFQAERYRTQLLPRARRAYELYSMKYGQMAAAYPQVLVSQRTLFQLQIAYLHALESEWKSALALQNYGMTGGLEKPE